MEAIATRFAVASNRFNSVQVDFEGACLACNANLSVCVRPTDCGQFAVIFTLPTKSGRYKLIHLAHTMSGARNVLAIHQ